MMIRAFFASAALLYIYATVFLFGPVSVIPIASLGLAGVLLVSALGQSFATGPNGGRPRRYFLMLLGVSAWMLVAAGVHVIGGVGSYNPSAAVIDAVSLSVLSSGFLILSNMRMAKEYLRRYAHLVVTLGLIAGVSAMAFADWGAGRSQNVWTPQYILWGFLFPWAWLLILFLSGSERELPTVLVMIAMVGMYVSLGLLFGKRVVFFQAVMILCVGGILAVKFGFGVLLRVGGLVVALSLGLVAVSTVLPSLDLSVMLEYTAGRVGDDDLSTWDRIQEFTQMIYQYSPVTPITGAGLGSTQSGPGGVNLHIGWLNFAFKGGLLFVGIELWVLTVAAKLLVLTRDRTSAAIAGCVVVIYVGYLVSSAWLASPVIMAHSVMKFLVLQRADEELGRVNWSQVRVSGRWSA